MKSSTILIVAFYALVMFLTGCSHGTSPIEPCDKEPAAPALSDSRTLLGLYTFIYEPDTGALDVIPQREVELHLNALKFLEPPPNLYLALEGPPQFNGNILDVDIGLRHPFLALPEYTGFDVCGIVFTHGSVTGFNDPDIIMAGEGDTRLLNADGYTRWWNPAEFPHGDTIYNYIDGLLGNPADTVDFNCTVNGYKYFADGLDKNTPLTALDLAKRGMFSAGKKNIRHYTIDMSGGLIFNYAVDACWAIPQGDPPYNVPDDFPQKANRPEAWNVSITELENSLYYNADGYAGGGLKILIDVWDHFDAGLNKVHAESLAGLPLTTALTPIGGGEGYSTYEIDLTGENLMQHGEAELLITMQSEALDYGGILPGKPVCVYSKHTYNISEMPPGWARTWGGEGSDGGSDVTADDYGNIYATGYFSETVDFDPGPGVDEHTSNGKTDTYLSKLNQMGDFQWAVTWGGAYGDAGGWEGNRIAIDNLSDIYIMGLFYGTVDFDPGPGIDEHTVDNGAVFLSKFDSDGNYQWVRCWGGIDQINGIAIAVDGLNNIYIAGTFNDTTDFEPGPGVDEHITQGQWDCFLSKFDADGNFQWARTWGGGDGEHAWGVAVDGAAGVYVTGVFTGTVDFDPGPGVDEHSPHGGLYDAFLSKFDSDGTFLWARTWGGEEGPGPGCWGTQVGSDEAFNVYVFGWFHNTVDFDPGPGTDEHTSHEGGADFFLSKFSYDGDFQWVRTWGGGGIRFPDAIAIDTNGNIYVGGYFSDIIDFDPGPGIEEKSSNGSKDAFLSKFNPSGDLLWARTWGGELNESACGVVADGNGNVFVTGYFGDTVDFNPGSGVDNHSTNGAFDAYICKFRPTGYW